MSHSVDVRMILSGLNTEVAWNGRSTAATNCTLRHGNEEYSNCLDLRLTSSAETLPDQLGRSTLASTSMIAADGLILLLCLLTARPMETITTELIVDGTKVPIYEEPRRTRFGINEILEIFSANRPSTMGRYCAVALADCWRLLEDLLDRYAGLSEQRRAALEVPLRWFAKGNSEFQSTDKFISHWIAFNSLYADPGVKEPDAISNYVRNRIAPSVAMRLVTGNQKTLQDLSRHPVTLGRQKARAIAQELSKALSTDHQHPLQVLESALLTIYAVRNGLFHGDHPPSATGTAWERVWLAESALAAIVRAILLSEVSSAVDADARTVKQESVAI